MSRTAFVTGGTGFVGLNLVQRLMADGWDVTALHRRSSDLTFLKRFSPRLVVGEITDRVSLEGVLPQGTDTLFHVAGNTNMWRRKNAEQTRDNVEGTRNVVEAAIKRGVRRLVVTSSISAYGPIEGEITEETLSRAEHSRVNYEVTKWRAQEIARAAVPRGLEVVILQPGAIMGPYDIGSLSRLFGLVRDNKLPGVPPAGLTFTHVREVVGAHVAATDRAPNGSQYILGGENRTMLELVQEIARLLGKPVPQKEMPKSLLKLVANVSDFASNFTGKAPDVTPEIVDGLGRRTIVKSEKALRELGYKIVPLKEMVKDSYDWLKVEGRI